MFISSQSRYTWLILIFCLSIGVFAVLQFNIQQPLPNQLLNIPLASQSSVALGERLSYTDGQIRITLTIPHRLASPSIPSWINQSQQILIGQYTDAQSPYPGSISDSITCKPEHLPRLIDADGYSYLDASLTSRLTYGSCDPSQHTHHSTVIWTVCPNQSAVKIEYITPQQYTPTLLLSQLVEQTCQLVSSL